MTLLAKPKTNSANNRDSDNTRPRVVVRLYDRSLADHIQRDFEVINAGTVTLHAARRFAAEIIAHDNPVVIPVGDLFLIASELSALEASQFNGARTGEITSEDAIRIINQPSDNAAATDGANAPVTGERLLAIATPMGFASLAIKLRSAPEDASTS